MARYLKALVPARLRRAVRARLDARYVSRVDHRHDIRDTLWEVQAVGRELAALRRDVERLRAQVTALSRPSGPDPRRTSRWDEAHRLAGETAAAMDRLLQNEVLLWQAVDRIDAELTDRRPMGAASRIEVRPVGAPILAEPERSR